MKGEKDPLAAFDTFEMGWPGWADVPGGAPTKHPDFTSQERAGMVAWCLARGDKMSIKDVQNLTELGERGAQKLIVKLARVLPIRRSEGVWASL